VQRRYFLFMRAQSSASQSRTRGEAMSETVILRPREVARRLGVSMATLYRWSAAGHLPRPLKVGPGASGWRESEIIDYLAGRPRSGAKVA